MSFFSLYFDITFGQVLNKLYIIFVYKVRYSSTKLNLN